MQTELAAILFTLACLLLCIALTQPLAKKFELPDTVLISAIGIILGVGASIVVNSMGLDLFEGAAETLINFPINSEGFLLVFLPLLVFQGAMAIDVRSLAHETGTVLLLAVVAVVVSTLCIGYTIYPFSHESFVVCLLLGCIVATTDPAAVAGIFRDVGAASRLGRLVEGEALLNDAAAIAIFSILVSAIIAHRQIDPGLAVLSFCESFGGAVVVGVLGARIILLMVSWLNGYQAAEATLTLVLPYMVYIICDDIFDFSGVVASAAAGLTVSGYGASTFRPQIWVYVKEMWEQLAFWAGSLVFLLASLFIPRLLLGMNYRDCVVIAVAWAAGLAARCIVIFGLLPVLSWTKLSPPISTPFKITMVWGGLRGAITLALALAVTENQELPVGVTHFVGIVATGFVLGTLLINGTTLRMLVVYFKLDQLSAVDAALRNQVIGIGLGRVRQRLEKMSQDLGFSAKTRAGVLNSLELREEKIQQTNDFENLLGESNRVTIALLTLANQERSLLLDLFRIQGLASRHTMEVLLRASEAMIDGARSEGRYGYMMARKKRVQPTLNFRLAEWLHRHFHIDGPLMRNMAERFEMLLILHLVTTSLLRFVRERMEPTLGTRITSIVLEILTRQRKVIDDALNALRLHYPGYAESLESRLLRQIALRLEEEEYASLTEDNLISDELARELRRTIERSRLHLQIPVPLNLRSGIVQRLRAFQIFNGLSDTILEKLSRSVSMRFLPAGEAVFHAGQKIDAVYPQLSGACEGEYDNHEVVTQPGDVLGALSLMRGGKALMTLTVAHYAHLLLIPRKQFMELINDYPIVRHQILHRDPFALNEAQAKPLSPNVSDNGDSAGGLRLIPYAAVASQA